MYSEQVVLEMVDLTYAAAGDPAQWSLLLERLAGVLGGSIATLHHQSLASTESSFAADWNMAPEAIAAYSAHYAPLNVWFTTHQELLTEGQVFTNEMLCSDDVLVRTEFYNDWLRPYDMGQAIGAMVFKSGSSTSSLSVFRGIGQPAYGEDQLRLLYQLVPHFKRAFQLHNRIQGLERKADSAADALDHLQQGVVLLDTKGRVLLVNQAARTLFAGEKALRLSPRGLTGAVPSENRRLNALIKEASATGTGKGVHSGGAMMISRGGLRLPLQALVTPLRTKTIHLGKDMPVVAIFISDPDRQSVSDPTVFAQLFGLTPAEARLASILASGDSVKTAAETLGLGESTLRSQLKSIFSKTNTNRQSELVRLFLLAPCASCAPVRR